MVIDPGSEKVWEASGADGLPQGSDDQLPGGKWHALDVAPLEPGRACVAGSFGRAWVATATFDAVSGSVAVKVIHEAREIPTGKDVNEGLRATVAFSSRGMFTLTGRPGPGGAAERRVILWRDGEGADSERHQLRSRPLVIAPSTPAVTVLSNRPKGNIPFSPRSYTSTETAAYTIETSREDRGTIRAHLLRVGLPDLTARRVGAGAGAASPVEARPAVQVIFAHGDQLHYIWSWHDRLPAEPGLREEAVREHFEWWTINLDGTRPRRVGVNIPRVHALSVSSHYGLVAVLHKEKIGFVPHLVEFDDPPKNEKDRAPGAALPPAR